MSDYHDDTDSDLVDLIRQGDQRAFEVVYRRYAKHLFGYALRRVCVREDCEEIVHDVFESLWKRRNDLTISSLKHYLFNSVRYMVIRYFNHRGVKRKFLEYYRLMETPYQSVEDDWQRDPHATHAQLLQHIKELPDRCQEAIRLRLTENLTNGEIAERMNINKTTVQLYISKAFAHLRGSYDNIFRPTE
ncbi:MAG: sigma-70 family RNA polymerase sigma factor [Bacteroidota bacterium]|nr:sigma-70 family RNA polymerase sigma factor [Bacteroidota bacterium]